MAKTIYCPRCDRPITADAEACPYCGTIPGTGEWLLGRGGPAPRGRWGSRLKSPGSFWKRTLWFWLGRLLLPLGLLIWLFIEFRDVLL